MTIEPEFSLDQPSQSNHLVPDGVLAKDKPKQVEQESDHRIEIVAGSEPTTTCRPGGVLATDSRRSCEDARGARRRMMLRRFQFYGMLRLTAHEGCGFSSRRGSPFFVM